jgi:hypothetical protein
VALHDRPLEQVKRDAAALAAAAAIQSVPPISALPLHLTVEEGYRIEEGFFDVNIRGTHFLLQGLIVKKADAGGKLPIMLFAHGTTPSMKDRQEMTPRGIKDANLRLVRDYGGAVGWGCLYCGERTASLTGQNR